LFDNPGLTGVPIIVPGVSIDVGPITQDTIVYVAETNGSCTGDATPVNISLHPITPPPIAQDTIQTCPNGQVTLAATTGGSNGIFTWYDPTTSVPTLTPPLPDNPTGYCYWVTETDPITGCESERVKVVVTTDLEILEPTAPDVTVCEGETATLTATSNSSTSGSFYWYNDAIANDLAYAGNPFITPNIYVNTTYYVVEDINGCLSNPVEVNIFVNPKPAAPVGMGATICSGGTADISVSGTLGGIQWYYDAVGMNPIPLATSTSYTTDVLYSTTDFYVTETNVFGCTSDLTTVTVTVLPLPSQPSSSSITLCEGETGTLIATVGAPNGTITWYNSDGDTIEIDTILPVGTAEFDVSSDTLIAGTSTIYYAAYTNTDNCESTWETVSVNVVAQPANPVISDVSVCFGNDATFNANQGSYNWYLDDLPTSSPYISGAQSFTSPDAITATTSFYVSQVAGNCESDRVEIMAILVPDPTEPTISYNGPVCIGDDIILTIDSPVNAPFTSNWTGPLGNLGGGDITFGASSAAEGLYTCTITNTSTGCTASSTILVEVFSATQSAPLFSNSPVCSGSDIVLTTSEVPGAISYEWSGPGIVGGTASTSVATYIITNATAADAGTYSVSIDAGGCNPATSSTAVTVIDTPPTPIVMDITVCEGDAIVLSATGTGGDLIYSPSGPNIGTLPAGQHTYTVTETNGDCESAPATINITVNAQPDAPILLETETEICLGESITLTSLSSGTVHWYEDASLMNPPGGHPNNTVLTPTMAVPHIYYAQIEEPGGCPSEVSTFVVNVATTPATPIVSDIEVCEGEIVTLSAMCVELEYPDCCPYLG